MTVIEDWDHILNATDLGDITCDEIDQADAWHTCSVGELLDFPEKKITDAELGDLIARESNTLHDLGVSFYNAIQDNDLETAQGIYDKIHGGEYHADAQKIKAELAKL